jgi:hypothetical protein
MEPTPDEATLSLAEWMDRLRVSLAAEGDPRTDLSTDEERLILDLARVAAHASERVAAPLTTFVAGVALAGLPPEERLWRLRELLAKVRS